VNPEISSTADVVCAGPAAALVDYKQFAKLLRRLHSHDWVVYAKPAFGGPTQVLRYLGRYTHRVAISNHRLLALERERVTFRWNDYARGGKQGQMTLVATEFLRRFFLHALPKGFVVFVTSASSPIAFALPVWRSDDNCWPPGTRRNRKLKQTMPAPRVLLSGTARAAAHR
jgi:hypothetical protein